MDGERGGREATKGNERAIEMLRVLGALEGAVTATRGSLALTWRRRARGGASVHVAAERARGGASVHVAAASELATGDVKQYCDYAARIPPVSRLPHAGVTTGSRRGHDGVGPGSSGRAEWCGPSSLSGFKFEHRADTGRGATRCDGVSRRRTAREAPRKRPAPTPAVQAAPPASSHHSVSHVAWPHRCCGPSACPMSSVAARSIAKGSGCRGSRPLGQLSTRAIPPNRPRRRPPSRGRRAAVSCRRRSERRTRPPAEFACHLRRGHARASPERLVARRARAASNGPRSCRPAAIPQ